MSKRILIVTGAALEAEILRNIAGGADGSCASEVATTLRDALSCLDAGGFSAIVADLTLPDSQGIETFDRLYSAAPNLPIMTLHDIDDDALVLQALQHGACGYLRKSCLETEGIPLLRNMLQRKQVGEASFIEKTRAEITLNSIGDAVIGTDICGRVDYINDAAQRMTGWSREQVRGHAIDDVMTILNSNTREPQRHPIKTALQQDRPIALGVSIMVRSDGCETSIEDSTAPIHDSCGKVAGAVMVFHDISAAQEMTLRMAHLAQHDFLTNLPNRVLLNDRVAQAIRHAERHHDSIAILFLDLDNFKHVNDSLGHIVGDRLLQSVARRLCASVRSSDTVSRQGGDEFVVLVPENRHAVDATRTAEKIIAALAEPHRIDGYELHVTTSIGISVFPADGEDAETLIKNADTAMYQAKERGRNNYQFFKSDMNVRAVERQIIETELRQALKNQEFALHYQPKIDLGSGAIIGAEALLRWTHSDWGMVLPARFVAIAEECGMILQIGRWVLREACAQLKRWDNAGLQPGSVAVNISALEFRRSDFVAAVQSILLETGIEPHRLELEITESVLMRNALSSAAILHELKNMGVQLAVDDFGTGYSSLSYLRQFPIDILKIDQSFIRDIGSPSGNGIVSAVIAMGASLRQRVIAEGVEDNVQLDFLKLRNCDGGQGYLFSRPLDAQQYQDLLCSHRTNYNQLVL
jgi:diguanylate cyclase (GGDEF)-like protein/PAS domain S-box-containing protein